MAIRSLADLIPVSVTLSTARLAGGLAAGWLLEELGQKVRTSGLKMKQALEPQVLLQRSGMNPGEFQEGLNALIERGFISVEWDPERFEVPGTWTLHPNRVEEAAGG